MPKCWPIGSSFGKCLRAKVSLMTALRAKGKEFDNVIILDVNESVWPSPFAKTDSELEQERRLFYVAFTRARKRLYMISNKSILSEPAVASRFLYEMGLAK